MIGAVVAQLFWLCVKSVFSCIAKDVVCKGLDHGTFVLTLRSCKFMIFLKGDAKFKFRLLLEGVTGRGKRAFIEIDRPSIPKISVLRWPMFLEKDFPY